MEIQQICLSEVTVVSPVGRVDSTTSAALDEALVAIHQSGATRMVVDFSDVEYISSAGLRVLLTLVKRSKTQGGALALCGLDHSVRQVFDLAGFSMLFSIHAAREDAVAFVSR